MFSGYRRGIAILLIFSVILFVVLLSDARVSADSTSAPPPEPASPPKVAFDEEATDSLPPPPQPATPPKADHTESGWMNLINTTGSQRPATIYNGTEYRFKRFVIRPAELKLEGVMLFSVLIYIILSYRGKVSNRRCAREWVESYHDLLKAEFKQVGVDPSQSKLLESTGPSTFYGYATDRKNGGCASLSIRFGLRPRQDLPMMIYEEIRSMIDFTWTGKSDRIELVWNLLPTKTGNSSSTQELSSFESKDLFVWGIVEKAIMNTVRGERWDVRTFTEIKESTLLPSRLVVMSESGELTDQILKNKELGLSETLKSDPSLLDWFDSLFISGTPSREPKTSELPLPPTPKTRTLTLRLRLPPPTSPRIDHTSILKLCTRIIDLTTKQGTISINPIMANKLVKRRTDVSHLMLEEIKKEAESIKEEEKRKKVKALQDEKFSKMSASEQKKFDERERKRNVSKMSKTSMKRK